MKITKDIKLALKYLKIGVIAHPTDTIYGLGCLANNLNAIQKMINLKKRDEKKGFILLASDVSYLMPYIDLNEDSEMFQKLTKNNKKPTTYLVPKSEKTPDLIFGDNELLAVRLTTDPLITYFCKNTKSALISSSANIQGEQAATSLHELKSYFNDDLGFALPPNKYNSEPSRIINIHTGEQIR